MLDLASVSTACELFSDDMQRASYGNEMLDPLVPILARMVTQAQCKCTRNQYNWDDVITVDEWQGMANILLRFLGMVL